MDAPEYESINVPGDCGTSSFKVRTNLAKYDRASLA